jgi:hypothetical protein
MATENDLGFIKSSPAVIKRFIRFYLGIKETPYWFHQTLTFKESITDVIAHTHLNKLLDSLRKAFPLMASFYVRENQKRVGGVHFHIIFLFFGPQPLSPEKTRDALESEIFTRWKAIVGQSLSRSANRLTLQSKSPRGLEYFLKGILPAKSPGRMKLAWHGKRQDKVFKPNWSEPSKKAIKDAYLDNFKFDRHLEKLAAIAVKTRQPEPYVFSIKSLEYMKAHLEMKGTYEWQDWKEFKAGRKISDADFVDWLNKEAKTKAQQSKPG